MLSRLIALLFAFVFSSAALAVEEAPRSIDSPTTLSFETGAAQGDASRDGAPADDERPLDDPSAQSQSEGAMDPPALMMARPDAKAPLVTMSRPRPYALAAWRAPYLDGPQRPPCAALVSA